MKKSSQFKFFRSQLIKIRQSDCGQQQRKHKGQAAGERGLGHKLPHQSTALGAHHLANAHFFGAVGRAGSAQVHKIDAGNGQQKEGHNAKYIHILDMAIDTQFGHPIRMQVDIGNRHEGVAEFVARFFKVGHTFDFHKLRGLRQDVAIDQVGKLGFECTRVSALAQAHVGLKIVA